MGAHRLSFFLNTGVLFALVLAVAWTWSSRLIAQTMTEEDARQALTSCGIEEVFSSCTIENPGPDRLVANFMFHADGRLELVSTAPAVSSELFSCFLEASLHLVLEAPGLAYTIAYPLERAENEAASSTTGAAHVELEEFVATGTGARWKAGQTLFYLGLALTLVGSGGMVAGHVLLSKNHEFSMSVMVPAHMQVLAGSILSLVGLKTQLDALRAAGYRYSRNLLKISLGTFLMGAAASSLLLIAMNVMGFLTALSVGMCELSEEECESLGKNDEEIMNGIWIGLGVGQALLLLSIIPRIVLQHRLNRNKKSLSHDLAALPFVSYGFVPETKAHVVGFAWAF